MGAIRKPFLCFMRIHRWTWVGRPGAREAYRRCRRCNKARAFDLLYGVGAYDTTGHGGGGGVGGDSGGGFGGDFGGGGGDGGGGN